MAHKKNSFPPKKIKTKTKLIFPQYHSKQKINTPLLIIPSHPFSFLIFSYSFLFLFFFSKHFKSSLHHHRLQIVPKIKKKVKVVVIVFTIHDQQVFQFLSNFQQFFQPLQDPNPSTLLPKPKDHRNE